MRIVHRGFGFLCGASGGTGFLLCLAGIVGCWCLHAEVVERAHRTFHRAESLLGNVSASLDQVGSRMRQTQHELQSIHKRETELAAKPVERKARRALSQKAMQTMSPNLGEARGNIVKATETALVVNGLLEALAELPLVERTGVDIDKLAQTSDQLSILIGKTDKLVTLLEDTTQDDNTVAEESSRQAELVEKIVMSTDEGSQRVNGARQKVADKHAQAIRWISWSAIALTAVLVWIAAGQISLLLHGRALVRKQ